MKTSQELKSFVDKHGLYVADNLGKSNSEKFDFITSILRAKEDALFAVICNVVTVKKAGQSVASFSGNGLGLASAALLVFTNKRVIVTNYSAPKNEPKYATFEFIYNEQGEQTWDIIEVKGSILQIGKVIVRFDSGAEIQLSVKSKECKHVADELRKFLGHFDAE